MTKVARFGMAAALVVLAAVAVAQPAGSEKKKDSELDALELAPELPKAKETPVGSKAPKSSRVVIEAAAGRSDLRFGLGHEDSHRASIDWRYATRLGPQWRAVVSDRLDYLKPATGDRAINTLREAYLGWQSDDAAHAVELGRINLRTGPGYGYNPSDFFRDGSLRTSTTLDPIALRDYRMGTVAVRAQRLWSGGGLSLILAPKLEDQPSREGTSLDLGSTNHSHRVQLGWSQDLAGGLSIQLLGFKQSGERGRIGANMTSLIGDSVVLHVEAAHGRERSLADRVFMSPRPTLRSATRATAGLTAALPAGVSFTAEYQYNGHALSEREFQGVVSTGGPAAAGAYLLEADRLQDLAARRAILLYLAKKDLGIKGLGLTSFVRLNADDRSRLMWAELRQALGAFDVALQWQQLGGKDVSEFGVLPLRRSWQLVLSFRP